MFRNGADECRRMVIDEIKRVDLEILKGFANQRTLLWPDFQQAPTAPGYAHTSSFDNKVG